MNLFGFLHRRRPIRELAELADFIDANAAFLIQKGIYEYSRARAGHYGKVLFAEEGFRIAVEESRWRAYPLGLAMVGEMVDAIMRPSAGEDTNRVMEALATIVLSVFDRYPVPASLGEAAWMTAREDLARQLAQISLHPPKRIIDIPEPFAQRYFAVMPIHEKLRKAEFPTLRNYMRVALCNIHDELTKRMDPEAMAVLLKAAAPSAQADAS